MSRKPSKWVEELIEEYLPRFEELNAEVDREAGKALSEEIIERLRRRKIESNLKWKTLKNPLTEIRKALENAGYELQASFNVEEWDEIGDGQGRQEYRLSQQAQQTQVMENPRLMEALSDLLNSEELERVKQASQKSGFSLGELVKRGLMAEAKSQLTRAEREVNFDGMSNEEVAASNSRESSQELARRAIEAIIAHNDQAPEKAQKWYISQGLVATFLKARLEANVHQATAKKAIAEQKIRIDDHNTKHGLVPLDNRKGANSPWRMENIAF